MPRPVSASFQTAREHGLVITALLTVAVFLGFYILGDVNALTESLASVSTWRIGAMLGLVCVSYAIRFLRWEFYLREVEVMVPLTTSATVFLSGLMMVITPGKAGEAWKAWFLKRRTGEPIRNTLPIVAAERLTDILALGGMALLGGLVYDQSLHTVFFVIGMFVVLVALLQWRTLWVAIFERGEKIQSIGRFVGLVADSYGRAYRLFRPWPLVVALVLGLLAWGLEGLALWVVLEGFVSGAPIIHGLFVFGFASVVGAASLLPGGIGVAELGMVGALTILGYSQTVALSSTIVIRAGTLWFGAVLGVGVFLSYRCLRRTDLLRD